VTMKCQRFLREDQFWRLPGAQPRPPKSFTNNCWPCLATRAWTLNLGFTGYCPKIVHFKFGPPDICPTPPISQGYPNSYVALVTSGASSGSWCGVPLVATIWKLASWDSWRQLVLMGRSESSPSADKCLETSFLMLKCVFLFTNNLCCLSFSEIGFLSKIILYFKEEPKSKIFVCDM
jgi:hypothetical protein